MVLGLVGRKILKQNFKCVVPESHTGGLGGLISVGNMVQGVRVGFLETLKIKVEFE